MTDPINDPAAPGPAARAQHLAALLPGPAARAAAEDVAASGVTARLPLRDLIEASPVARDSASNIMELAGCGIRDIERLRSCGAGLAVLERFVSDTQRLPRDAAELAAFLRKPDPGKD